VSSVLLTLQTNGTRLVKTLFEMARENKPSIIFIDELDALCGNRDNPGSNEHTARMKTELMVQIDGVGNDNTGVLLLAATNLPWTLDPAMRRRFQRKIHIPLPDEEARVRMFEIHVGDVPCGLEPKDYAELGKRAAGLSGSDISIAVQDALMQPVKKISSSKFWRKVDDKGKEKWTPCKEDSPGSTPMNWRKVPASRLLEPTIEVEDFFNVLAKVKPSVAESEIVKCVEWTKEFGLEGA
jgi:vacuolar protein-sorting-associated protein 4